MHALLLALALAAPPAALPAPGAPPGTGTAAPTSGPRVRIRTTQGDLVVALDPARAPATVANFLRYVDAGRYAGGAFHRTVTTAPDNQPRNAVKIDVVQAGPAPGPEWPPVRLERTSETGLRHVDGAISMARDGPDTATADFFVCVGAQPELDQGGRRNPDGQGFAVFGQVVSGMEVVRRIHRSPASGQSLSPPVAIVEAARLPP